MYKRINLKRLTKSGPLYVVCGAKLSADMMYQLLFLLEMEDAKIPYSREYVKLDRLIKKDLVAQTVTEDDISDKLTQKGRQIIKEILK